MAFDIAQNGFNRNILYCKYWLYKQQTHNYVNLIGTFCIVNVKSKQMTWEMGVI